MSSEYKFINFTVKNLILIQSIAQLSSYFQAWKIYSDKDSSNVSFISTSIDLVTGLLFIVILFNTEDKATKIGSIINIIGLVLVFILVIVYRQPKNRDLNYPTKYLLEEDENARIKKFSPDTYSSNNVIHILINDPILNNEKPRE